MRDPYDQILRNRSKVAKHYAAMTFNSTTWRMFKKGESKRIRAFLMREIGDGKKLATCRAAEYDEELVRLVGSFQNNFKMNKGMKYRKPGFGHASKVINLYVRHLLLLPGYMAPFKRRKLEMRAHVPLDKWVLISARRHFHNELAETLKHRSPALKDLDDKRYFKIQRVLADAAQKRHVPPITYDYFYAWRGR